MGLLANAVIVNLDADSKHLEQGFDRAGKKMDEFEGKAGSVEKSSGGSFVNLGNIVSVAMGNVVSQALSQATSAVTNFVGSSLTKFSEFEKATTTLEIMSPKFGQSAEKAKQVANELAKELNIGLTGAAEGLGNLMKSGLNLDQAQELMKRFNNEALIGKSANIGQEEAVRNLTFAYNTQNSALGNMSGISENFSNIQENGLKLLQSEGKLLGLKVGQLNDAQLKQAQYAGTIELTNLTLGAADKFKGQWIDTQAKMNKAINDTQVALGKQLEPALNSMGKALLPIIESTEKFIKTFKLDNLKQLAPIFTGIGVAAAVSLVPSTATVTAFGASLWVAMAPLLPFIALAAGVAAVAFLIQQNWSTLQPYFEQFATMAMSVLNPALQFLGNLITTQLVPAFNQMLTALKPVWDFIEPLIIPALKILGAIIGGVIVGAVMLFIGALIGITYTLTAVANSVTGFCAGVKANWEFFTNTTMVVWNAMWESIKAYAAAVFLTIYYLFTGQSDKIGGVWSAFGTKINEIWSACWNTVSTYLAGVWGQLSGHFTALGDNIKNYFGTVDLTQMGKNMIQGLINGLQSMGSSLINSITSLVNNAVNSAKSALGIHSPSLVFKEEIGVQMMAGISEGLKFEAPNVYSTLEDKLMALTHVNVPDMLPQVARSYQSQLDSSSKVEGSYNTVNNYGEKQKQKEEHTFDFLDNLAVLI